MKFERKIDIRQFDFGFKKHIPILIEEANKRFNNRSWVITASFFADSDYEVRLTSSWGGEHPMISYKKSEGVYKFNNIPLDWNKVRRCSNCGCEQ